MLRTSDAIDALRNGFVTGLFVVAPLTVTLVILSVVYGWLVGFVRPVLSLVFADVGLAENVLGLLGLGGIVTAIGLVFRVSAADHLVADFDGVMERIPVIRAIYSPTRDASAALLQHGEQFERVAIVEWPRTGLRTIGFVTGETPAAVAENLPGEETHFDVFVAMSPNPMGGFLAIVPESQLRQTDISVKTGLQMVITTGLSGDGDAFGVQQDRGL